MIQKGYVYGTAAEKLDYQVPEENKVPEVKKNDKKSSRIKFKLLLNVFAVFAICFIIIFRYALITELNYKINKSNISYNEIKNENSRIKVELEKDMDLHKVKEVAESRLGMQKPDKFQIVYVNVPKSDFTIVSDSAKDEKFKGNVFMGILNKIGEFTRLLY